MAARSKAKRRAPLVESDTEEALRRRGTELLGLILLGLGALAFILIWTYSPDDPSLFNSTDAPPQNALGLVGAWIADPLFRALGWASYGIPAALMVWGSRLVLHAGETRAVSRALATPVAILAAAAFASTHVPLAGWPNDFGLGGMLGDAVLGNFLTLLPLGVRPALLTASFALGAVFIVTTAFALGVTLQEARRFLRYLRDGSITLYAGLHRLTGRAAKGVASGARSAQSYASERRARRAEETVAPPLPKPSRRSGGIPPFPARTEAEPMPAARPDEDGVMAKITAAVRARAEADAERTPVLRNTPPLSAGTETTAAAAAPRASLRAREPIPDFEVEDDDDEILIEPGESRVKKAGPKPSLRKSLRARAEEQPELALNGEVEMEEYAPPALSLLQHPDSIVRHVLSDEALEENARMLENVLDDYGVRGEIVSIRPGPVVTMYELEPAAGLKASRVIGLSDDIARSMSALACRVSTIPGRSVIGIELPNDHREKVLLREILAAELGIVPAGVPLEVTNFEKPILAAPCDFLHFNLAQCEDIMLLALCIDGPVGIDIEPLERAAGLSGCEETFCHPQEIAALPEGEEARNERLLEIWTAKEALLKAAGCGLLHPPEAVWIDGEGTRPGWRSDPPLAGIDGWELRALDDVRLAGHRAFVCTPPGSRLRFAGAHS